MAETVLEVLCEKHPEAGPALATRLENYASAPPYIDSLDITEDTVAEVSR